MLKLARHASSSAKPPTALLMMNMGGPKDQDGVYPFLANLFSDPDLIPLGPLQKQIAPWIAYRRTPSIKKQYAAMGGGSPIGSWTQIQGEELAKSMDIASPETAPHKAYVSFRYAAPMTNDALEEMMQDKVTRAIAFSLYPQYSCSTTGSSLNELHKHIRLIDTEQKIKWSVVDRWFQNPGLISTFAEHINASLAEYPESQRDQVVLMFSAHSLPMSVVNRGDPYPAEVAATVAQVMALLGFSNPYRLVWQSQVGPSEWLGPKTSEAIVGFSKKVENVLLIPIAFVSDHVETLFELDIEYKELCEKNGLGYKRVESLNDDPMFIKAMEQVVLDHMQSPNGRQLMLQCPGCHKESCKATKAFFSQ